MKPGEEKEIELDHAPSTMEMSMLTMRLTVCGIPMIKHQTGSPKIVISCMQMPTAEEVAAIKA
jgi:hypothetical protein